MRARLIRLVAAALLAAATGPGVLAPEPAAAATCAGGDGVTVVVDFHQLGGGVHRRCDADGAGQAAATLFPGNGFPLTYVQRMPGFVCRVSGVPADDPCVNTPPTDAYWGLFWSDGTSGTWSYASEGVAALSVPAGGYVGFSWQASSTKTPPGVTPTVHTSASPSASPTTKPPATHAPGPTAGAPDPGPPEPTATASAPPSGSPRATRTRSESPSAAARGAGSASASPTPVAATGPPSGSPPPGSPSDRSPSGALPGWLVGGALVLLAGAAGVTAHLRRRSTTAP